MEGGIKIEINKNQNSENQGRTVKVDDGNFVDKENFLKEETKKKAIELENLNDELENPENSIDRKELFKEIEEVESKLESKEKELLEKFGIDDKAVMAMYEELNEKDVAEAVEEDGAENFVSCLVKNDFEGAKKLADKNKFNPAQVAILFACFLFLILGAPNKSSSAEISKAGIESSQELEKNDIEKFFKKLEVVKIFHNQEYLDMKIPAKPKGHEDEDWQIMIYENGTTIGSFDVGIKSFFGAFGRNRNVKIDKVELVIEKDGKFTRHEIDISGKKEVRQKEKRYQKKVEFEYDSLVKKIENQHSYKDKFDEILKILKAEEISNIEKSKIQEYLIDTASEYVDYLLNKYDDPEEAQKEFEKREFMLDFSNYIDDQTNVTLGDLDYVFYQKVYEKETSGLSGMDKVRKIGENSIKFVNSNFYEDSELTETLNKRIEEMKLMDDDDELGKALEELSGIFDNFFFKNGSPYLQLAIDYDQLKKDLREKKKMEATENYLNKAFEASEK